MDDGKTIKTIVPDFPKKKASKFFKASESIRANDSERKAFEYIMGQIKFKSKSSRLNFKPGRNYEGQGFSGKITVNSEMTPCDSCEDVMTQQFKDYFGDDITVEVKYGVEFKNKKN